MSGRSGARQGKRSTSALIPIALALLGTIAGVVILEVAARVMWKAPWYEQLMAEQQRIQTYNYKKNSWNMRDRDYERTKPAGTKRVFMLGDSFTFGLGVPNDSEIFPEIIEARLNEQSLDFAPNGVEVLNAGRPATLTGDWVESLQQHGPAFDPDLVLIVFFLRDGSETLFIPEFFMRIRSTIVARNDQSFLYQKSFTYRLVRDRLDRRDIAAGYTRRFTDAYFGNERQTAEWQRAQRNLRVLRDLARERLAKIGLVIFPVLVQLNENYPFREICDLLQEYCDSIDVPVYNLLPDFMGQNASDLWVSPWDQHPNAKGHAIVADSLTPFVRRLLSEDKE